MEENRENRERRTPKKDAALRRRRRKRQWQKKVFRTCVVIFVAIILFAVTFKVAKEYMSSGPAEVTLSGEVVVVTIPQGATTKDIAEILEENGLIGSVWKFRFDSRLEGYDGKYQQGTYEIDTGLTSLQIMELLQTGVVQDQIRLVVPEGFDTQSIAKRVEELGICSAEEFIEACNSGTFDYDFLVDLPEREHRLEGYLFPATYQFPEGATAHEVIDRMLNRFDIMYTPAYRSAVETSEYTLDELVIIASIVEKEIILNEERPTAAGVIYNRLNIGMRLQIDATVQYAQGFVKEHLLYVDLEIDSPYNTYRVNGLPVGPISNPGEESFKGALFPEEHKYIYYVLEAHGRSNHIFCETDAQFLAAKNNYKASIPEGTAE